MALRKITSKFSAWQQIRTLLHEFSDKKTPVADLLDQKIRIISTLSLNSPDGQVASIEQESPSDPVTVTLWQNGLTGALGALPLAYSEWMTERYYRYGDRSAKAFLSIFEHRLYCLSYLAWQRSHLYAREEFESSSALLQPALALCGLLTSLPGSDAKKYAHLFSSPVLSLVNLESWLSHYYDVPVSITPFISVWQTVDLAEHCRLGCPQQTLSTAPMVGRSREDVQSHFNVTLGPMTHTAAQPFFSDGDDYRGLSERIQQYVGPTLNFRIFLCIFNSLTPLGSGKLGQDMTLGESVSGCTHLVCLPESQNQKLKVE